MPQSFTYIDDTSALVKPTVGLEASYVTLTPTHPPTDFRGHGH